MESKINEIIGFFIYDSIKIFVMLFVFISILGFLRSFVPREKVEYYLKNKGIKTYFFASFFGAITPFCSCSSIPLFIGFIKNKLPLGISFAFLITSPLINEYLVVLMLGFFGYKITLLYILNGIFLGILCGIILDKLNLSKYVVQDINSDKFQTCEGERFIGLYSRIRYGVSESLEIINKIWIWVIVSVFIGALIHGYVPREKIEKIISYAGILDVPIATILGVPLYGSCASILPIAYVLFTKGLPLGTTLSFMMSTSALSLPEAIVLRRVIKTELILIFFSIVTIGIIFIGYVFNYLQRMLY
ncbi:MAG: permease [Elusimicrobiales bacterium]|nr:permease [Elusimicrobiales bacterium]HOJ85470.1 permease [Elusimicrobiales bacterium]HOL62377.1 permease [Elusimicrobiales bacterium]HPO96109.1 permease [Elusimicrobiales bacterium]